MPTTWTEAVEAHAKVRNFSPRERDALLALESYRGRGGLYPSHARIAERGGCKPKTVQRAVRQAEHLGLLTSHERREWRRGRWVRTSNSYRLTVPGEPVQAGLRLRRGMPADLVDQRSEEVESVKKEALERSKKAALADMHREAVGLGNVIAIRQAAIDAANQSRRAARWAWMVR